jgi:hypothetical protein
LVDVKQHYNWYHVATLARFIHYLGPWHGVWYHGNGLVAVCSQLISSGRRGRLEREKGWSMKWGEEEQRAKKEGMVVSGVKGKGGGERGGRGREEMGEEEGWWREKRVSEGSEEKGGKGKGRREGDRDKQS